MNVKGTKKKNQVVTANIFEQQELWKKAEVIKENLIASTWRELETNGKFYKNEKLSFISDSKLAERAADCEKSILSGTAGTSGIRDYKKAGERIWLHAHI